MYQVGGARLGGDPGKRRSPEHGLGPLLVGGKVRLAKRIGRCRVRRAKTGVGETVHAGVECADLAGSVGGVDHLLAIVGDEVEAGVVLTVDRGGEVPRAFGASQETPR